jgi:hypothetical protein
LATLPIRASDNSFYFSAELYFPVNGGEGAISLGRPPTEAEIND